MIYIYTLHHSIQEAVISRDKDKEKSLNVQTKDDIFLILG